MATIILKCCLLLVATPLVCSELAFAQTSRRGKTQRPPAKAQASPQTNAAFEQFVKRGDEARLAQRLDEAISLYGQALKIKPTWPEGWWYIGAILYEKDLYAQGRDAFQNLFDGNALLGKMVKHLL